MLIWVALMGAGVDGGFLLMAIAGDQIPVPVAVAITGLSVVSAVLAAVAVVREDAAPEGPQVSSRPKGRQRRTVRMGE